MKRLTAELSGFCLWFKFAYLCHHTNFRNMLKYATITFALILAILDFVAYKRLVHSKAKKSVVSIFAASVILANSIPLLLPLFVFKNTNNETTLMKVSMILITAFVVLALCRFVLYIFWLPTKRKKWLYTGGVVVFATLSLLSVGIFITRTNYKVNEIELSFDNLPVSFNGYRIVFISDIHVGSMYNAEKELEKLSKIISETDADILVFGGDMVNMHHSELTPAILDRLSLIKSKKGSVAVLGNHDTGAYLRDSTVTARNINKKLLEGKLDSIGWVLLRDSTKFIYRGNDSIAITGIDYTDELLKFKHNFDNITGYDVSHIYSAIDNDVFNITVSHLPMLWYELCDNGYSDLTLSGHIHAMQFKYNLFGFTISPASFMYKEWSGLYEREKGKLYINDGVGSVGFFARFGARPEITVITLMSSK